MRRAPFSTVAASLLAGALAACTAPSEPSAPNRGVAPLRGTPLEATQGSVQNAQPFNSVKYDVPPGVHNLHFNSGVSGWTQGLQFSFAGRAPVFRIRRVRDSCGAVDITFADATLQDASKFFDDNAISAQTGTFYLTVENSADVVVQLHVTGRWLDLPSSSPPCGL